MLAFINTVWLLNLTEFTFDDDDDDELMTMKMMMMTMMNISGLLRQKLLQFNMTSGKCISSSLHFSVHLVQRNIR